jgi:hypothetical protein
MVVLRAVGMECTHLVKGIHRGQQEIGPVPQGDTAEKQTSVDSDVAGGTEHGHRAAAVFGWFQLEDEHLLHG